MLYGITHFVPAIHQRTGYFRLTYAMVDISLAIMPAAARLPIGQA